MTTESIERHTHDDRVALYGISWDQFETILEIRGDDSGARVAYLDGELEFMSPSRDHERLKKMLARLVEIFADERGVELNGYGSWTLKKKVRKAGAEPDECYVVGPERPEHLERPDFLIEVIWTSGGLDKLEVYRRLEVPEVWFWEDDQLLVHFLGPTGYTRTADSHFLPGLDLKQLVRFVDRPDQSKAAAEFRAWLRTSAAP